MTLTGARNGQKLEHEMYWHCSTHINSTHVILIGGRESGFKSYIYNLNDFHNYFYGPELSVERKGCAAAQILHPNETAFVIIIGPDDTSELLNTDDIYGGWMIGEIEILYRYYYQYLIRGTSKRVYGILSLLITYSFTICYVLSYFLHLFVTFLFTYLTKFLEKI